MPYDHFRTHSARTGVLACIAVVMVTVCCGFASAGPVGGDVDPGIDGLRRQALTALNVSNAWILSIDLDGEPTPELIVPVELDGIATVLDLRRRSLRDPDFELLVEAADGTLERRQPPTPRTYAGTIAGLADSRVVASLDPDGGISAMIRSTDEQGRVEWIVQPASTFATGQPSHRHAVFRTADRLPDGTTCGTDDLDADLPYAPPAAEDDARGSQLRIADIAFDADREFYQANGSNVDNTVADIESVMNGVEEIYQTDVDIAYEITTIIVRTAEPDPYTPSDPGGLLGAFANHWNLNNQAIRRDVAHLMTGRNLDGSVIGIASLRVICNRVGGYGLSQSRFSSNYASRVGLTAHELGHNWSSAHCNDNPPCKIMCSGLGGCNGDLSEFGPFASAAIGGFAGNIDCLEELAPPVEPPFFDRFDEGPIDSDLWIYNQRAATNPAGPNAPTPAHSLNLDSLTDEEYYDDELRSNFILLGGAAAANLSFFVQERGCDPEDSLTVEYWGNDATWHPIVTLQGSTVDSYQDWFQFRMFALPAAARHDQSRIRFITDGDTLYDDWQVDNVTVAVPDTSVTVGVSAGSVPPGGQLLVDAAVTNLTGSTVSGTAWIDVVATDGSPLFASNPKFGPKPYNLQPAATKQKTGIPLSIPGTAAAGTYTIRAYVGSFSGGEPLEVQNAGSATFTIN